MPDFFTPPASTRGLPRIPKADGSYSPNILDLIGEGVLSPLGLGSSREEMSGMNPDARGRLNKAGAAGELLSMLLPMGIMGEGASAAKTGMRAIPHNLPKLNMSEMPSLREFTAVGAEAPYVRPSFKDPMELAYDLARKSYAQKTLKAQGATR